MSDPFCNNEKILVIKDGYTNEGLDSLDDVDENVFNSIHDMSVVKNICNDCKIEMQFIDSSIRCLTCGREEEMIVTDESISNTIISQYNTHANCPFSLKAVGIGSNSINKSIIITGSDYSKTQSNVTKRQLSRLNANSKYLKLPNIVLDRAAEIYGIMQKNNIVRRGKGRLGLLGACIFYSCSEHGITKRSKDISKFVNVEESYISSGDKDLRNVKSKGKLEINIHYNPQEDYINQYFDALRLDEKYKPVISDIIDISSQHTEMRGENNSRISTKCAGAIFLLVTQLKLKINMQDIVKYCNISTIFTGYYEFLLKNRKRINKILVKHSINIIDKHKKKKQK